MKCLRKSQRGFTLIEMVLVIAIILILVSAVTISVVSYMNTAKNAKAAVSSQNVAFESSNKEINNNFMDLGY